MFSTTPIASTTLYVGETKFYKLPSVFDAEGHTTLITNSIPKSFITFDNIDTFKFAPNTDIGIHTVSVTLSDGNMQTSYSFNVIVMSKPGFTGLITAFSDLSVPLGNIKSLNVPSFSDADGDSVSISIEEGSGGTLPSCI